MPFPPSMAGPDAALGRFLGTGDRLGHDPLHLVGAEQRLEKETELDRLN